MTAPQVMRRALLLQQASLYGFFASAVLTATIGPQLLHRTSTGALITHETVGWRETALVRRHIIGSLVFGNRPGRRLDTTRPTPSLHL